MMPTKSGRFSPTSIPSLLPIRVGVSRCLLGDEVRFDGGHKRGLVPLIVPITLIKHYVTMYDIDYLQHQVYLNPHPKELMLRNYV